MTPQEKKNAFLDQFPCVQTRAYAERLYELHEQSIEFNKGSASKAVLEIVDFYETIDDRELTRLGIPLPIKKEKEAA